MRKILLISGVVVVGVGFLIVLSGIFFSARQAGMPGFSPAPGATKGISNALRGYGEELLTQDGSKQDGDSPVFREGDLTQRKVVKNGSLSLIVKSAEDAATKIQSVAERMGGFVGDSNIYEVSSGIKSGSVTIRVPAQKFEEAMAEVKKLAVKVERETVNARDVTEQYVDLEARLKNFRAEEEQYLGILKRASDINDILQVTQRLHSVRSQIEQIQGQLQYLSRQIDMSSITVSLTSEADIEVFGIRWRPLFVAKQALRSMFSGITGYMDIMIRLVIFIPVLLLWLATIGVGVWIVWRIIRWIRARFFSAGL